jgi:hypothetical protein
MEGQFEAQSPMQLLSVVSDQALTNSLSRYIFEAQMACQSHCETQIAQGAEENQLLSEESSRALEKQCNKQCSKKFIKSLMLYNKMMKETE